MADPDNASYPLLSFKYQPLLNIVIRSKDNTAESSGAQSQAGWEAKAKAVNDHTAIKTKTTTTTTTTTITTSSSSASTTDKDLPSLSSLMSTLEEMENGAAGVALGKREKGEEEEIASGGPKPGGAFHRFGDLPTELRIKIWELSLIPRVVELRPTRPHYSASHDDGRQVEWQSGCTNPAVLAACTESRDLALVHFRIAFPLASITSATTPSSSSENLITNNTSTTASSNPYTRYATSSLAPSFSSSPATTNNSLFRALNANDTLIGGDTGPYNFRGPSADGKAKLLRRTLYIAPESDTVCIIGQHSDIPRLRGVMSSFLDEDPLGVGITRLGLSVKGWGWGGSAFMLRGLTGASTPGATNTNVGVGGIGAEGGRLLSHVEQLYLFMYGEQQPPTKWRIRGTSDMEAFRVKGNRCELVQCEETSPAYRWWAAGKGRQFWDTEGGMMKIGGNEIKVMELEFHEGW